MFLPSKHGFKFDNAFPKVPDVSITVPGLGKIELGDASLGLCGGMVFAAADYFSQKVNIPEFTTPPEEGSPLFRFIVKRFIDSVHAPWGLLKAYQWMASYDNLARRSYEQLPLLHEGLADGPVPLTLIKLHSLNPFSGCHNHQVLAYAIDGEVVKIYDPNYSGDDDCTLTCDSRQLVSNSYEAVRGFYLTGYTPVSPNG